MTEPNWIDDDDDAECPNCGGDGFTYNCIDNCCEDAEWGCEQCERICDCQRRQAPAELQEVLQKALISAALGENLAYGLGMLPVKVPCPVCMTLKVVQPIGEGCEKCNGRGYLEVE